MKSKQLNLKSKLKDLFLYEHQLKIEQEVKDIDLLFKSKIDLPGVIVLKEEKIIGLISRKIYTEYMNRSYSFELFINHRISKLSEFINTDFLLLSGETSITQAMLSLLNLSRDLSQKPIVIELEPQVYRLLDVNQLMLAHSEIQIYATHLITQLYQQLEDSHNKLQEIATLDGLTGISNRRNFEQCLQQEWRRAIQENKPIALILSDVDYFKNYNDTYGHQMGDNCLRSIAAKMSESVKRPGDLVARYGGEEFVILLPNTEAEGAAYIAEEIRQNISALKIKHSRSMVSDFVTISLGVVSLIPQLNQSSEHLVLAADLALYNAKKNGRDRHLIYGSDLEELHSISNLKISSNLIENSSIQKIDNSDLFSLKKEEIRKINYPEKINNTHMIDLIRVASLRANLTSSQKDRDNQ